MKKMKFKLPPPEEMLKTCTDVIAYVTTIRTLMTVVVPPPLQKLVVSFFESRFGKSKSECSLIVEDRDLSGRKNSVYEDLTLYFGDKVREGGSKIRVSREPGIKDMHLSISKDEDVVRDELQGVKILCKYCKVERPEAGKVYGNDYIKITFEEKQRDFVIDTYLPHVENIAAEIRTSKKVIMMHTNSVGQRWDQMRLIHPSTFDTMALSQEVRSFLIHDIDRFIGRREYYKKVGKAWKRGFLLYGPPGTGKSSLVAAIANYLKFDIYDLQLTMVPDDASLRKLLLNIGNGSVLVVEDIDRSVQLKPGTRETGLSVAGVLNCIDGIWSSCGEERIIIFTTNNKGAIDDALLRPGRMDVHIHMGHCCFDGFKTLAFNYLDLEQHALFPEIERLLEGEVITPAQVAEEFMKTEDKSLALENFVELLKEMRSRMS